MKVDVTLVAPETTPAQLTIFATIRELRAIMDSLEGWNVPVSELKHAIRTAIEDATSRYQGAAMPSTERNTTTDSKPQKVCLYSDGCPMDGPVCHLCEHVQP